MKYEIKEVQMSNWVKGQKETRYIIEVGPFKLNFDSNYEAINALSALRWVEEKSNEHA